MTQKKSAVATINEFLGGKLWYTREAGEVTVGLTSSTIEEIGAVQSVDFPETSGSVEEGDVIAVIEGDQDTFEVTAPMDGFILDVNDAARDEPNIVSEDPLEEGWVIRLEPMDLDDDEVDDEMDDEAEDDDSEEDEDLDDEDEDFDDLDEDDDYEEDDDEQDDEQDDDR